MQNVRLDHCERAVQTSDSGTNQQLDSCDFRRFFEEKSDCFSAASSHAIALHCGLVE